MAEQLKTSLPNDENAEKYVLGSIFLNNDLILESLGDLKAEHFYFPLHQPIYRAMEHLADTGREINHVTVPEALKELKITVGSPRELAEVISSLRKGVPKPKSLLYYVQVLKDRALEREKIRESDRLREALLDGDLDTAQDAEYRLQNLAVDEATSGLEHTSKFSEEVARKIFKTGRSSEHVTGVATGIADFDVMTTGLQPDDFVVFAARPGVGKTAMAMNIAQFASIKRDYAVAVYSLEMSKAQLYMRMLASEARIPLPKIRTGFLNSDEWARLIFAQDLLDKAGILIDDTADTTPLKIKASLKRLMLKQKNLGLVIIDYLQLLKSGRNIDNRQQEMSEITRAIKIMAKELHVPIIALSQLSRETEKRTSNGHRPRLSDLRDSGSIEQDADIVGFIYREELYGKTDENAGLAELIIEKHRNGPTDTVKLLYTKECTRFENLFIVP